MGNSFNTKGAVPSLSSALPTSSNSAYGGTPYSNALNKIGGNSSPAIPIMKPNSPTGLAYGGSENVGTGQYTNTTPSVVGNNPGLIAPKNQDVKSHTVTNVDGSTVSQTYHPTAQPLVSSTKPANDANGGASSANPNAKMQEVSGGTPGTPSPTPNPTPTPSSVPPTYAGLVGQVAQGASQPNKIYTDAVTKAEEVNKQLAQSRMNEAQGLADNANNPIPLRFQQGRAQVLQNQYLQQQNALAGEYQGATSLVGSANTQQGLNQSGLISAAGLAAPQGYGLTTQPYNPLTDTFGGGGTGGAIDRATQAGNISTAQSFAQDYNTGKAKLAAADGIQSQIVATLQNNPTLNNTPVSGLTNLNELLSGQISSGPQQLLSQQIAQYISTLGLDPASVTNIAHQQKGTLAQLLDSLRKTAETVNESKNPANLKTGSSNSGSYTSNSGNTYNLPY